MIRIARCPDTPATLTSEKVRAMLQAISELAAAGTLRSTDFESHWNAADVRSALYEMQKHKCSYCERIRDKKRESDIDHFRPKALYWWLAYQWDNLFFTCRACNQEYKKDQFPLETGSVRANPPDLDTNQERFLLLHPCIDDPEQFLRWTWDGCLEPEGNCLVFADHRDERGRETVRIVGLNEGELPTERGRIAIRMDCLITKYKAGKYLGNETLMGDAVKEISAEIAPTQEFLALRRAMLRSAGLGWIIDEGARIRAAN